MALPLSATLKRQKYTYSADHQYNKPTSNEAWWDSTDNITKDPSYIDTSSARAFTNNLHGSASMVDALDIDWRPYQITYLSESGQQVSDLVVTSDLMLNINKSFSYFNKRILDVNSNANESNDSIADMLKNLSYYTEYYSSNNKLAFKHKIASASPNVITYISGTDGITLSGAASDVTIGHSTPATTNSSKVNGNTFISNIIFDEHGHATTYDYAELPSYDIVLKKINDIPAFNINSTSNAYFSGVGDNISVSVKDDTLSKNTIEIKHTAPTSCVQKPTFSLSHSYANNIVSYTLTYYNIGYDSNGHIFTYNTGEATFNIRTHTVNDGKFDIKANGDTWTALSANSNNDTKLEFSNGELINVTHISDNTGEHNVKFNHNKSFISKPDNTHKFASFIVPITVASKQSTPSQGDGPNDYFSVSGDTISLTTSYTIINVDDYGHISGGNTHTLNSVKSFSFPRASYYVKGTYDAHQVHYITSCYKYPNISNTTYEISEISNISISGANNIVLGGDDNNITINHSNITTSSAEISNGKHITGITTDGYGHITNYEYDNLKDIALSNGTNNPNGVVTSVNIGATTAGNTTTYTLNTTYTDISVTSGTEAGTANITGTSGVTTVITGISQAANGKITYTYKSIYSTDNNDNNITAVSATGVLSASRNPSTGGTSATYTITHNRKSVTTNGSGNFVSNITLDQYGHIDSVSYSTPDSISSLGITYCFFDEDYMDPGIYTTVKFDGTEEINMDLISGSNKDRHGICVFGAVNAHNAERADNADNAGIANKVSNSFSYTFYATGTDTAKTTGTFNGSEPKTLDLTSVWVGNAKNAGKVSKSFTYTFYANGTDTNKTKGTFDGSEAKTLDLTSVWVGNAKNANQVANSLTITSYAAATGNTTSSTAFNGSAARTVNLTSPNLWVNKARNAEQTTHKLYTYYYATAASNSTANVEFNGSADITLDFSSIWVGNAKNADTVDNMHISVVQSVNGTTLANNTIYIVT